MSSVYIRNGLEIGTVNFAFLYNVVDSNQNISTEVTFSIITVNIEFHRWNINYWPEVSNILARLVFVTRHPIMVSCW